MLIRPIVISGPSGGGKSTILKAVMQRFRDAFAFSVSHTTRSPRAGEREGHDYWFTTIDKMKSMISAGDFLEYAEFGSNLYGTSKKAVEDVQQSGKICVLDVELQGVRNIKKTHLKAKYILIKPPNMDVLEQRLRARNTETDESLAKRLRHAKEDADAVIADPSLFDYIIINDDLKRATDEFIAVIDDELRSFRTGAR